MSPHRRPTSDDSTERGRFPAVGLSPRLELTFAPWESFLVDSLGMSVDEALTYSRALPSGNGTIHRLLGHPDPVQGGYYGCLAGRRRGTKGRVRAGASCRRDLAAFPGPVRPGWHHRWQGR